MSAGGVIEGLAVSDVVVRFGHGLAASIALNSVSMTVGRGRTVALVGESGSGKSTLAKAVVGIVPIVSGAVTFDGNDVNSRNEKLRARLMRKIQMIPQDPYSSLSPRRTVGQTLAEAISPARANASEHRDKIVSALESVVLKAETIDKYPHQLSGGQRQRVAIARALIVKPELIIADEITSALDVSAQAEVLELIGSLREKLDLTILFISHNLAVVQQISDDVVVLCRGSVMEAAPAEQLFKDPQHEYTRRLLDAVPGSSTFSLD